jgi:hypothetical protein
LGPDALSQSGLPIDKAGAARRRDPAWAREAAGSGSPRRGDAGTKRLRSKVCCRARRSYPARASLGARTVSAVAGPGVCAQLGKYALPG